MTTAADTNALYDVLIDDPTFGEAAEQALHAALEAGPVVICPIVYAELAARFDTPAMLDQFLRDMTIERREFSPRALVAAAQAWNAYTRRRGQDVQCPECGQQFVVTCPRCNRRVVWRQHMVADFLIGAHALSDASSLLTRDRGYYRTYFPQLHLRIPTPPGA